jgi:chemotaxis protein CheX
MHGPLIDSVARATKEIVAGALAWKVSNGRVVTRPVNSSTAEASAIIGIVGSVEGTITLKCTRRIAVEVARAMLGVEASDEAPEVRDAVGELLNMVIGQAKTYYAARREPFSFTLPTTIMGDNYQIYVRARPGAKVGTIYFLCPLGPFSIEVFVKN